ncbi:MAG TPA: LuxR C-terminal-related transcriptional regulator [Acidimicrobiales bacterium]|nr:LuxR C-terminal-related transcriptional regulator [Acidimicrobiales bacterium]
MGREPELDQVAQAMTTRQGVVLAGDAGVGKSRLLGEAVDRTAAKGLRSLYVRATRSSGVVPLGAFAPLLPVDDAAASLARAREAILARDPAVLAIDDAHALDDASAALAHQLVTQDGVRVLATVRRGEEVPDAIVGLWKDGLCERLDLEPLARSALDRLVVAALGGPVDARFQHLMWSRSLGNVLYAHELLGAAVETGALTESGGIWTLTGPFTAPPRLRELIAGRLLGVRPEERTALDLLALAEPLPLDLLGEIAGGQSLEHLEERGLLVIDDSGRADARLNHPLLADVLLDALGPIRRRRLLRDLVAAVTARPLPVEAGDRVVRWRIDAGLDVSPGELLTAARRYALVDAALAESLARRAVASEGGDTAAAAMTLAEIMAVSGRPDEAASLLGSLPSGSSRQRCRQEADLALVLAFGLNRPKDAAERLEALLDDLDDRDWAFIASQVPLMWLLAGEIHRARQAAEDLLADERASDSDRLSAELVLIPALNLLGQPVTALDRASHVVPRLADHPAFNEYMVGQLATAVPTGHRYVGDLDLAEETGRQLYDRFMEREAGMLRGVYALRLGQIALWRGALAHAEQHFLEAVTALEGDALTRACAVDHVRYTRALTLRPDMPGALPPGALYAVEHGFLSAAVEAATGELSYARSLALGAARRGVATGHVANAVFALYEAARHGAAPAAAELARELPPLEGRLLPALVDAVAALAQRDHAQLEALGGRLAELGCLLHAAELMAAAATAAAGQGLTTAAARLRTRAQELAEHCDGASTELLRNPVGDGLTTREREVAGFAARGLTDVEIAARLSLSRRTVETHLYRVYAKLGVSGRRDLAPLFTPPTA